MTERLTSKIALDMVLRIEALQRQIEDIYAEARSYEGENNDSVIADAVQARSDQRELASDAEALIGSFDWDDEGNRTDPAPEAAWPLISAKLKRVANDDPRILKQVALIDRLHELSIERGLPVVTAAEFDTAIGQGAAEE